MEQSSGCSVRSDTGTVATRRTPVVDASERGGDFYMATREDIDLATREDFLMATDIMQLPPAALTHCLASIHRLT